MRPVLFSLFMIMLFLTGCSTPPAQPSGEFLRVPLPELIANAEKYNNMELCTDGYYMKGFEVSTLADSFTQKEGYRALNPPLIWIEQPPLATYQCMDEPWNARICIVVVCGKFMAGGQYGHMGGFQYQFGQIPLFSGRSYTFPEPTEAVQVVTLPPP